MWRWKQRGCASLGWDQQDIKAFTALFISEVGLRGSVSLSGVLEVKPAAGLRCLWSPGAPTNTSWAASCRAPTCCWTNQPASSSFIFFLFTLITKTIKLAGEECVEKKLLVTNRLPWVSVWTNYWTHNWHVFAYEGRRRSGKPLIPSSLPPASLQDLPSLTAQTGCREEPLFGAERSNTAWTLSKSPSN